MHRPVLILAIIVTVACSFCSNAAALDDDSIKEEILTAIEKKYAGKSFEASFTQTSTLAALDVTEHATGMAYFSHPKKMRWEYLEPERHEIITNGKLLWIFRPEENQVMTGDAQAFFKAGAGGAFLSDISLVRKNYTIRIKKTTPEFNEIELTAKIQTPDISSIMIRVLKKNNEIKQVITYNLYKDTTLFEFDNIHFKKIDPGRFEFQIPEGSHVIKMD